MESLELDDSLDLPANATPSNAGAATDSSGSDETIDVHAAWSADQPTVELPTIDTSEIDPFDLIPGAGAESLFDAGTTPVDDVFLTETDSMVDEARHTGVLKTFDFAREGAALIAEGRIAEGGAWRYRRWRFCAR